jgi:hypothetical protein
LYQTKSPTCTEQKAELDKVLKAEAEEKARQEEERRRKEEEER